MESAASNSTANKVTRSESLRKRTHEQSSSSSCPEVSLPTKFKPSGSSDSVTMDTCTAQFVMEQRVQDVEEHFRRSLQSFQLQQLQNAQSSSSSGLTTTSSFSPLPLATTTPTSNGVNLRGSKKGLQEDHEPHQILITENSSNTSSPTSLTIQPVGTGGSGQTVLTSQNNVQFIVTSTPPNNVMAAAPLATNGPALISALPGGGFNQPIFLNIPASTNNEAAGATTQVITSPTIAQKAGGVAGAGGAGTSVMLPTFQGVIPTIAPPQLIPLIDNGGALPQVIPTVTSASTHTPLSGASPVFYVGNNSIPMLTQSGVIFMNPTDITRPTVTINPQAHAPTSSSSSSLPGTPHHASSLPSNYIIIPSPFANPVGYSLASLEQLAQAQAQQLQQQSLKKESNPSSSSSVSHHHHHHRRQKVNIDLTTATAVPVASDDRISVGGSVSSMEEELSEPNKEPVIPSGLRGNVDSVEEHFARALGDQWHQVKAGIGVAGGNTGGGAAQSKITA